MGKTVTEVQQEWLTVLRRLEVVRRQGSSLVLSSNEVRLLLAGIESYEEELAGFRHDDGPLVPMTAWTQDDAAVVTS